MQRAGRDPGIECIVREVKGERGEESSVKGVSRKKREREKGVEERRYGEARMLHRVAALSLHCVPLRHSLVQRFIQLGVPRTEGQAVAAIALRADSVASLFLSSHYPRNSRFLNSSIEFAFFFFFLFFRSFVKYHRYIRNQ